LAIILGITFQSLFLLLWIDFTEIDYNVSTSYWEKLNDLIYSMYNKQIGIQDIFLDRYGSLLDRISNTALTPENISAFRLEFYELQNSLTHLHDQSLFLSQKFYLLHDIIPENDNYTNQWSDYQLDITIHTEYTNKLINMIKNTLLLF